MRTPSEHRLHPVALVFGLWGQLRELGFTLLAAFLAARSTGATLEIATAIATVPVLGVALTRLLTYRYGFDRDELVIRYGLVFRRERRIPLARIQNLDSRETPLHRLTGTVAVRVETGTAGEVEAELVAVPRAVFDEMMRAVAVETPASVRPDGEVDEGEVVLALDEREVVLAGVLHGHGGVIIAALVALVGQVSEGSETGVLRAVTGSLVGGTPIGFALAERLLLVVAGFLIVLRILSVIVALVRFHGHEVRIVGSELRTTQGLFTRSRTITPLGRIQTVTVRQGPLHRLTGRVRVQITTAGGKGTGLASTREVVAPVLRVDRSDALVRRLLPGMPTEPAEWHHAAPRARGRAIRRVGFTTLPLLALGWWLSPPLVITMLVASCVAILVALGRIREFAYQAEADRLVLSDGWLWRRTVYVPSNRIQSTGWRASPFDRRAGMAAFRVDTAGQDAAGLRLPYLAAVDAEALQVRYYTAASGPAFAR